MHLTVDIVYDLEDEVKEEDSAHSDSKVEQPPPKQARKVRQLMLMYMITVPDQLQSTTASLLEQSRSGRKPLLAAQTYQRLYGTADAKNHSALITAKHAITLREGIIR